MESTIVQRPFMPAQLFRAAIEGNSSILKELLGLENEEAKDGHVKVTIDVLEDSQNYLQSATYMGNTVLHVLATYGLHGLVTMLCKKDGSLWRAQNKMFETPFHCAAKFGHEKTISALIEFAHNKEDQLKVVLRERNNHGETALHEAARRGHAGIVSKLMEVDVTLACELNNDGMSPLYLAAARGNPRDTDMVKSMLEQLSNSNIDPATSSNGLKKPIGPTELDAAFESSGTIKKIMVPTSVVKNAGISRNILIQFLASSAGSVSMIKLLLEKDGSLAYIQDSDGLFPVHLAAREGNVEIVALLLKMYPDSGELLDYTGRNFFHVAAKENKSEVFAKLIIDASEDGNPLKGLNGMFKRMMIETDNEGNTPLHLAAGKGHEYVMKTLLKMKWLDHSLRNKKGLTPFDLSVIQVKETMKNIKDIEDRVQKYIQEEGACFSEDWFKKIIHFQDQPTDEDEEIDAQSVMNKIQVIGLGSVLITTVTFAAAFTLPGGMNSDNGTPVLGQKYAFKAFILANTYAFIYSFQSIILLMNGALSTGFTELQNDSLEIPLSYFSSAARCLVIAFGLGLYVVLSPYTKPIAILVLVIVLNSVLSHVSSKSANPVTILYGILGACWKGIKAEESCGCITFFFGLINFMIPFLFIFFFAFLK